MAAQCVLGFLRKSRNVVILDIWVPSGPMSACLFVDVNFAFVLPCSASFSVISYEKGMFLCRISSFVYSFLLFPVLSYFVEFPARSY